jgi:pimeloyl-ACP methyl ester carboxylesterase
VALLAASITMMAASVTMRGASGPSEAPDYAERGPYEVAVREISVPRPGETEAFDAGLFVPLPPEIAAAGLGEGSAIYAFGHGYLSPIGPYESTLEHLASRGITVVAPRSGAGLRPSHEAFGADLVAALDAVAVAAAADDWEGVPVDVTARAVGGHSMGGGAAVLAAAMDPSIRTVATLSAADTRPSAVEAAATVEVPMLLVAASEDRITPVDGHQRPIFEAANGPTQLLIIEGGGHCGYLDQADLMGLICGRASLDAEAQRALGRAALTAWLRSEAMADETASERAWQPDGAGGTTVEIRGRESA